MLKALPPKLSLRTHAKMQCICGLVEAEIVHVPFIMGRRRLAVDAGANDGVTTSVFAQWFDRVVAFEANPELAARTARGLSTNASIVSCALSSVTGTAELRIPVCGDVLLTGWASLDRPFVGEEEKWQRVTVQTRTLDSFGLQDVDLLKIDVEGHELEVLRGSLNTIERNRPWIIVEASLEHREEIVAILWKLCYRIQKLQDLCNKKGSPQNIILIPE